MYRFVILFLLALPPTGCFAPCPERDTGHASPPCFVCIEDGPVCPHSLHEALETVDGWTVCECSP